MLDDGGEVDLDLGNYERYLNVTLSRDNNITTGKIYREVIENEVSRASPVRTMFLLLSSFSAEETTLERPCRRVRLCFWSDESI